MAPPSPAQGSLPPPGTTRPSGKLRAGRSVVSEARHLVSLRRQREPAVQVTSGFLDSDRKRPQLMTAQSNLKVLKQKKEASESSFCLFPQVESFLVANLQVIKRSPIGKSCDRYSAALLAWAKRAETCTSRVVDRTSHGTTDQNCADKQRKLYPPFFHSRQLRASW